MIKIPVVGEKIEDWKEVEKLVKDVEACGMRIVKVLNFKEGSTKFIAKTKDGVPIDTARKSLEKIGWMILTPYYSNSELVGFKIARARPSTEANAWGG